MSEQMQELVEEIQDIYKAGKERRLPNISPQQLIVRIGKVILNGESKELDRLLRVTGRSGVMSDIEEWADRMATCGAMDFIAFRPEEKKNEKE